MQKMKEEANRFKELELKRAREIAQLRKESRKRENEIRTLQMDKRVKETVLKRKQEEVNALRKNQVRHGGLSDMAAGRVVPGKLACFYLFLSLPLRTDRVTDRPRYCLLELCFHNCFNCSRVCRCGAGRNARKPRQPFSPKVAKQKWARLEHNLSQMALNRLTVSQLEKDLER